MVSHRERWIDAAAGPLVRPYTVTCGRTERRQHLDVITIVTSVDTHTPVGGLQPEHDRIRLLCVQPLSIAEIAATLRLPLLVTKVLVGDLIDTGHLMPRTPNPGTESDTALLGAVLEGLRRA